MNGYRVAAVAIGAALIGSGLWNAATLSTDIGYDAAQHKQYAHVLIEEGHPPAKHAETRALYDNPPGFYAVAGAAGKAGEVLGMDEDRGILFINVLFVLGAAILVGAAARELWPGRPLLQLSAFGFAALLPLVAKAAAFYHPAALTLLLAAAAVYLTSRILVRADYRIGPAVALGAVLLLGVAVLPSSLWVYGAVVAGLGAAALARRERALIRTLAVVLGVTAIFAVPWAVRQHRAGIPLLGNLPELAGGLEKRSPSFFFELSLPEPFEEPYRESFQSLLLPTAYTDLWGDYFGNYAWNSAVQKEPATGEAAQLIAQNTLGLLPTLLAVAGVIALGALAVRGRERRAAVIPALALLALSGFLYYATNTVTPDGDTIKPIFMTSATPAWALGFGFAVDRLARGRWRAPLLALLALAALVNLRFVVSGSPLGGLL